MGDLACEVARQRRQIERDQGGKTPQLCQPAESRLETSRHGAKRDVRGSYGHGRRYSSDSDFGAGYFKDE